MKKMIKKNKKGFTLIELIVVIAILAILALILVPSISNYVNEANQSKDFANARTALSEVSSYAAMNSTETGADCSKFSAKGLTLVCTYSAGQVDTFEATSTDGNRIYTFNKATGDLEPNYS